MLISKDYLFAFLFQSFSVVPETGVRPFIFITKIVFFLYIGLGIENEVLDSAEFYDLTADKWTQTSALKVGRTEHVMGLVYGIPTVIGGKHIAERLVSLNRIFVKQVINKVA